MTIQEFLEQLLAHMGCVDCVVNIQDTEDRLQITLQVSEADSGMLIGRKGETLSAIQHVLSSVFRDELGEKRVSVDINEYKKRRMEDVEKMAQSYAEEVKEKHMPITLPYLNGEERRTVHMILKEAGVVTQSSGEGSYRRLTIYPEGYQEQSQEGFANDAN